MWSWSTNVTDGRTNRRTTCMQSQYHALHYYLLITPKQPNRHIEHRAVKIPQPCAHICTLRYVTLCNCGQRSRDFVFDHRRDKQKQNHGRIKVIIWHDFVRKWRIAQSGMTRTHPMMKTKDSIQEFRLFLWYVVNLHYSNCLPHPSLLSMRSARVVNVNFRPHAFLGWDPDPASCQFTVWGRMKFKESVHSSTIAVYNGITHSQRSS